MTETSSHRLARLTDLCKRSARHIEELEKDLLHERRNLRRLTSKRLKLVMELVPPNTTGLEVQNDLTGRNGDD